jgi:hypothetical protein
MSPEIPAICGSITKTMRNQASKMHINSQISKFAKQFHVKLMEKFLQ